MSERRKQFPFDVFEPRWQAHWRATGAFHAPNPGDPGFDPTQPKYYVLDMFPYPSGDGLHVGHPEGYTATDILARAKRMQGFNVLHPMGWDAFGLPAEQYAIRTGQHPRITTQRNVVRFREQLDQLGLGYDWDREVNTTDPGYFRWTQWIFLKVYDSWFDRELGKARPIAELEAIRLREQPDEDAASRRAYLDSRRLAYVAEVPVNWCPELGTVLANEEVIDGKSEVGGFDVVRRPMRQWMLRITEYAERLIRELDGLDWPDSIKLLQRNWIGRSEGARVRFTLGNPERGDSTWPLDVFTTRPDTLFGATYVVLSPEHPLVDEITSPSQAAAVASYRKEVGSKSDLERTDLAKTKSGVPTGAHAINPVNGEKLPVWIADYVLMGYGTGAIMAVPGHDERDHEFATQFGLPIRIVVLPPEPIAENGPCFTGDGASTNSGFLDGLPTVEAKRQISEWLAAHGVGEGTINYKLRDWLFSRQRYWGEPFPILWESGSHRAVPDAELPVLPPDLQDFKPTGTAEPPLSKATDWVRYSELAKRETNTMPQWAGSCWYYLRYCDPQNDGRFVGEEAEQYWMGAGGKPGGVDLYVGGTEHAVLHLMYARFWHKVLHDLGDVSTPEPFQKLVNQGMILGEDGQKMSKSRGNVIGPEQVVAEFGADAFRLYEMFMGPLEQTKPWSTTGVEGVYRFLGRAWRLCMEETQEGTWAISPTLAEIDPTPSQLRVIHATIQKVTEDLEALAFNTAISQMMIFVNEFTGAAQRPVTALNVLLRLLNPFAPHIAEELWHVLGERFSGFESPLHTAPWPIHDPALLVETEVELAVQVNGKVRGHLRVLKTASPEEVQSAALALDRVIEAMDSKPPRKIIVVPGRLVNIVV